MNVVLVTGATGLLGGVLARALSAAGYDVTATGRLSGAGPLGLDYRPCELADARAVESLVAAVRPAAIVHAAGRIRAESGDVGSFARDNVTATQALAAAARAAGVGRFVFCSTVSVYSGDGPFAENAPTAAADPYGASKRRAEEICFENATAEMPVVILRLGGLHGHPRRDGVVHTFFDAAARGEPIRVREPETLTTLTFLDDVAGAVRRALAQAGLPVVCIFNVATAETITLRGLAEAVRDLMGGKCRIEPDAAAPRRNRVLQTAHLHRGLGFRPGRLAEHLSQYAKGMR